MWDGGKEPILALGATRVSRDMATFLGTFWPPEPFWGPQVTCMFWCLLPLRLFRGFPWSLFRTGSAWVLRLWYFEHDILFKIWEMPPLTIWHLWNGTVTVPSCRKNHFRKIPWRRSFARETFIGIVGECMTRPSHPSCYLLSIIHLTSCMAPIVGPGKGGRLNTCLHFWK